jgi:YtkA-like protein
MFRTHLAAIVVAIFAVFAFSSNAYADIADYEFQLVSQSALRADTAVIAVRIVHRKTLEPVDGAIIFASRLDMEPDGMEAMTAPLEVAPGAEAGVYRFTAGLAMAGGWRLSLAAKIQGEEGTLQGRLVFQAVDQ